MHRLKALFSTPRWRLYAVVAELVLVGCVTLLGRAALEHVRSAHSARAQSRQGCPLRTSNACPEGATCEAVNGVGRCAGDFEDAQSLWQEARYWVGRRVVIRHAQLEPDRDGYECTQMACSDLNPCCNSCQARAHLINAEFLRLADVDCIGNECEEPACGISDHAHFWVFKSDAEIHGKVRDDGDGFSLEDVSINGQVAQKRDLYGRPLE